MKKLWFLAMSLLFGMATVFGYAGSASAAAEDMSSGESCLVADLPSAITQPPRISGSNHGGFIGATVFDRDNQEIGKVADVTAGPSGEVNFFLIYSCLPGMADKLVAYPVREFDTGQAVGSVTINTTKEEFQQAPTIESKLWPSGVGTGWVTPSYRYFENTF